MVFRRRPLYFDDAVRNDNDVQSSQKRWDDWRFFSLGERMTVKKTQSKANKPAAKPRARKPSVNPSGKPIIPMPTDEEIARQAYALWEHRGRPTGSPEHDWYRAKEQLRPGAATGLE
jgi:6-phosphogluconolactonase/glucosamine-6-phosphate isomerase/deaminase